MKEGDLFRCRLSSSEDNSPFILLLKGSSGSYRIVSEGPARRKKRGKLRKESRYGMLVENSGLASGRRLCGLEEALRAKGGCK